MLNVETEYRSRLDFASLLLKVKGFLVTLFGTRATLRICLNGEAKISQP
jgi:hypothetical protein